MQICELKFRDNRSWSGRKRMICIIIEHPADENSTKKNAVSTINFKLKCYNVKKRE
jgi:hypothetical protein